MNFFVVKAINVRKILVPMDGSKNSFRGLDQGVYLARQFHATITGLYVVPIMEPAKKLAISSVEKFFINHATKFMEKAKIIAAKKGIKFQYKILYGDEGPQIVSFAKKTKSDIIIIGSRGRSLPKEIFLGSTSNYVLHKSPIPVLIVK